MSTFKSQRAAAIAVNRATRAYDAAHDARIAVRHWTNEERDTAWAPTPEETAELLRLEAVYSAVDGPARYQLPEWAAHCDLMNAIGERPLKNAEAAEDAAWQAMKLAHDAARADGFYVSCRHLESNATRELIMQNID